MSIDAIARDIAEHQAGASWDELRAQEEALRRQMDTYWAAYRAAVASERQQAAFAPPPLTIQQTATALNVSRSTVYELIRTGKVNKVTGLNGVVRIPRAEIDRFLEGTTT